MSIKITALLFLILFINDLDGQTFPITLKVIDFDSKIEIKGAIVYIDELYFEDTETDDLGIAYFEAVPKGKIAINIRKESYRPLRKNFNVSDDIINNSILLELSKVKQNGKSDFPVQMVTGGDNNGVIQGDNSYFDNSRIVANEVNIFQKEPEKPAIQLFEETINSVNPEALNFLRKNHRVCIAAQQAKMNKLISFRNELIDEKIVKIYPGNNMITAINSQFGDCLNDIDDFGLKDTYEIELISKYWLNDKETVAEPLNKIDNHGNLSIGQTGGTINQNITVNRKEDFNAVEKSQIIQNINLKYREVGMGGETCVMIIPNGNHPRTHELCDNLTSYLSQEGYRIQPKNVGNYLGLNYGANGIEAEKIVYKTKNGECMQLIITSN